jgi:urea-proton symporter
MFCSGFTVGLYPLWEGRHTMKRTAIAIYNDVSGKRKPGVVHSESAMVEEDSGTATPTEKIAVKQ